MAESPLRGRILWYELMTTDVAAAEDFYRSVVGWTVTPFRTGPEAYDMWMRGDEASVGGVMKIPAGMAFPPFWSMYVGVPSLEEGMAEVERLGGGALSEVIDVPEVGRMRAVRDPQGAMFSLYEPAAPPPAPEAEAQHGEVAWHELMTTDAEGAMRFYAALFGWQATESMDMGEMGTYHMFGRAFPLGGMMNKPPGMEAVPPNWGFYFRVADVNAAKERVEAGGGKILNGPMEVPGGGWIVNCMDPQGAAFSLYHKS